MSFRTKFAFIAALALALIYGAGTFAQVIGVSIAIAPPVLPVYVQPPVPAAGYIWTPGYWAYANGGYYWVPGTWVEPPRAGLLWTPGYWAANGGGFVWNAGYWAPEIGFYGGVNYGFGYVGVGFQGGHWDNGRFFYNRAVTNVSDTHITNIYNKTVVNDVAVDNTSYNGGKGGTAARPTAHELAVARQSHLAPTSAQVQHQQEASMNKQLFASVNHGNPAIAATQKPGSFSGSGVVAARGAARGEARGEAHAAKSTPATDRSNATIESPPTARAARVTPPRPTEPGKVTDRPSPNHSTPPRADPAAGRRVQPLKEEEARSEPVKKERKEEGPRGGA